MSTYRSEIQRLKKGIIISWVINILIMSMTIEAAIIFSSMSTHISNKEIAHMLMVTTPISILIGVVATAIVSLSTSRIMMSAATGDMEQIHSGVIYNIVDEMCIASNVPMPEVFILKNSGIANAYAVSDSKRSRVVITDGLVSILNRGELQGVIAHEIGHLASGDSRAMTTLTAMTAFTGIVSGSVWRLVRGGREGDKDSFNPLALVLIVLSLVFLIAAPFLSKISQAYMSRERESNADMLSVKYTGNPNDLATALLKLQQSDTSIDVSNAKRFDTRAGYLAFHSPHIKGINMDTHPPIEERVKKLISVGASIK